MTTAAAVVRAQRAPGGAVLARRRDRDEVEGARPEPVRRAGERAHGADLHGVAGEVGVERLVRRGADLLLGAALEQLDHRVARDLLGEPGAARAGHAALTVEEHLRADVDRLLELALRPVEAALRPTDGHRLVLQGALAALVAHRAVQGVVQEQELHDPLLGEPGHLGGVLGVHLHALGQHLGAGGLRLGHALDLDEAGAAGRDRLEEGMVAEARDLDAELLGGADHEGALGHPHLDAVDDDGDEVDRHLDVGTGSGTRIARDRHRATAPANT